MLILTRRPGEAVMIDHDVTVKVLAVRNGQTHIGINAPKSVPVHREEIYQAIQREQQAQSLGKSKPAAGQDRKPNPPGLRAPPPQ